MRFLNGPYEHVSGEFSVDIFGIATRFQGVQLHLRKPHTDWHKFYIFILGGTYYSIPSFDNKLFNKLGIEK